MCGYGPAESAGLRGRIAKCTTGFASETELPLVLFISRAGGEKSFPDQESYIKYRSNGAVNFLKQ